MSEANFVQVWQNLFQNFSPVELFFQPNSLHRCSRLSTMTKPTRFVSALPKSDPHKVAAKNRIEKFPFKTNPFFQ
ncbi:hypothetical protein DLM78_15425 [Leptospira stimsonii]|uniref:Uncharacterized protein n=1 Tax=Leptospira stimsonii TaxID=2202203 RepID=A0A8B3CQ53_9LEPT|nr:hypothetical protein DLM78_15425 [Leptospira stimsonii]